MLVMCALGVSAVLGVDATIIPFKPGRVLGQHQALEVIERSDHSAPGSMPGQHLLVLPR